MRVVILAAGKGARMGKNIPKTLLPVGGKPILQHLVLSVKESGLDPRPIIVVGHEGEKICDAFHEACDYAVQKEQLGTAHAVMAAREVVGNAEAVIVLYGDHPFFSAASLRRLADRHEHEGRVLTITTTEVPNFEDWYRLFHKWGRILRDPHRHIIGIREYKDAMGSEQEIREVNPGLYCFDTTWLWENIHHVKNFNAQGEYYLTDLIELAVTQGEHIASIQVDPEECVAVNTPEELAIAEKVYAKRS